MHKVFEMQRRGSSETITFELPAGSGQVFEALPDAPGAFLIDVARLADATMSLPDRLKVLGSAFDMALTPKSLALFEEAFRSPDPARNITLREAMSVLIWLVSEVYVGRPTEAASPSSTSPPSTGLSSMANGQQPELTRTGSPPADSPI